MRLFLTAYLAILSCYSYGQVTVIQPRIQYVSKWDFEDINWMKVGDRILFRQECTSNLPPEFPTGVVLFENVFHQKDRFSAEVEFKDSVVVSVIYYLKAKQFETLKAIGYSQINVSGSPIKGQWTYTLYEEKRHTVIVGDKKRIVVVQTI